jgi:hypothetical protein
LADLHESTLDSANVPTPPVVPTTEAVERLRVLARGRAVQDGWKIAAAVVVLPIVLAILSAVLLSVGVSTLHLPSASVQQYAGGASPVFGVIALAALALGGQFTVTGQYAGSTTGTGDSGSIGSLLNSAASSANVSATVTFAPLVLTALTLVGVALWTRDRLLRTAAVPASWWQTGLVAGVFAGVAIELLAGVTTAHTTVLNVGVTATAAGWRLFFGALLLTVIGTWAGYALSRVRIARPVRRAVLSGLALRAFASFGSSWRAFVATVSVFSVVFTVSALIGVLVFASQQAQPVAILSTTPLVLGSLALLAASLGQFGELDWGYSAVTPTSTSTTGVSSSLSVFNGSGALWLTVGVALVAVVVTAFVLRALEPERAGSTRRFWLLPAQLAGLWLVVPWTIGELSGAGSGGVLGFTGSYSASASVSAWFFLLAGIVGFLIEALARFVLPSWSRGGAQTASASTVRLVSMIVAAFLALGVLLGVGIAIANATVFSSASAVRTYTDAIAAGDVRTAQALETGTGATVGTLPAPNPGGRIQVESVKTADTTDQTASVAVTYLLAGRTHTASVDVARKAPLFGVFDQWRLTQGMIGAVEMPDPITTDVSINGVGFKSQTGALTAQAYPGIYTVAVTSGSGNYVAVSQSGQANVLDGQATDLAQRTTGAVAADLTAQMKSTLDACVLSATELVPAGCPVSYSNYYGNGTVRNVAWTVSSYPTMAVDGTAYSTVVCGTASVTYQDLYFGSWSQESGSDDCVGGSGTFRISKGAIHLIPSDSSNG